MKRMLRRSMLVLVAISLSTSLLARNVCRVIFYTPSIVRVVKSPTTVMDSRESMVVIAQPTDVKLRIQETEGETIYSTSELKVTVERESGRVNFYTSRGERLMCEGEWSFVKRETGPDSEKYRISQSFALEADEPIYGLGMLQNGKMNLRGEHRLMQQSNTEDYTHFFQSLKGYGIYWDNYSPTRIDDASELRLESEVGTQIDYYFMYGGDADGVIKQMRYLTGSVPMLPLWTYGFHQCRERYKSQGELLEVVNRYRAMKIPFDGIIQDWQYWGSNYTWNAMEFISEQFQNAQSMIDQVHENNAHISISIWSSFGPQTKPYKELNDKNLLFDFETWPQSGLSEWPPRMDYPSGVRVYDCYSSEARDIYWNHLSRLHKMGIDGWWMDSTDPDHHSYKDSDLDEMTTLGSYRSLRNLYPFMTVGGVDAHQRAVDREKRVFILTRSLFAGQQRYGANTWSGDVNSSWESLRRQVPLCLNHTMCANPNVNTDIGGFFANSYNRGWADNSATTNPQYQELYVRWMQFGLFNPMMRSHGTEVYRELYYYGKPGEPVYDALLSAVKMRYNLLPYIYSTSWQVSTNNDSFMRPLVMDFRNDRETWNMGNQFMFGKSLLVCPVTDPLYTEERIVKTDAQTGWDRVDNNSDVNGWPKVDWNQTREYKVYLPQGTQWYDFWTGERYDGGTTLMADAPLSHSPLYVKAGTILPWAEDMQYSSEKSWDNLTLKIYPGANATFLLYEDEGDGYNYLEGAYSEIEMRWNDKSRTLTIEAREGDGFEGMLTNRQFIIETVDGAYKRVEYRGKKIVVKL